MRVSDINRHYFNFYEHALYTARARQDRYRHGNARILAFCLLARPLFYYQKPELD